MTSFAVATDLSQAAVGLPRDSVTAPSREEQDAATEGRRLQASCNDLCHYPADGICDDGGDGSQYDACTLGSDCTDCGVRVCSPPAPP
eukprot:4491223-Prymnesium_polylepis.1